MMLTTPLNISDPNHTDLFFVFYFPTQIKNSFSRMRVAARNRPIAIHSLIGGPSIGSQLRAKKRALAIRVAQDHPRRARGSTILSSN